MTYQGRKVVVAGDVFAASDMNSTIDQTVMVFAGTAARSSAIGTATEGMTTYLQDVNQIQYFDGSSWVNDAALAIPKSIVDAKGDLIAATGADAVARLAVGANNLVLTADSTASTGVKWAQTVPTYLPPTSTYYHRPALTASTGNAITALNTMTFSPIYISQTTTLDRICFGTTTVTTGGNARLGIYTDNGGKPGSLVLDAGVIAYTTSSTSYEITISQVLEPGWYWLGLVFTSGSTTLFGYTAYHPTSMSQRMQAVNTTATTVFWELTGVSGALPASAAAATIRANAIPAVYVRVA